MNPITQVLDRFPILILDGAMATELESHGCELNDSLWSAKVLMENPDIIRRVHMDYFEAGADCAITASYQATVEGYMKKGLTEAEAVHLIGESVRIAVEARDAFWEQAGAPADRPKPLVAASVGPYGAFLADGSEYRGDYSLTEDELVAFHRDRIKILIEAGADILACETIPCLMEAKAIIRVLQELPGVYAWITFSAKDALHISSGERIADCAAWLDGEEQVAAVGINCTPPRYISPLIQEIKSRTAKPIIVYPNSGEAYDAESKTWGAGTEADNSFNARSWYQAGASLIGGCCRTAPEDIEGIASWARK
ncbi:homocysteine S-methyltransferase [Ectobacillus ponti]|uniref:S-methylmethionine:homocysteine methyltransferase n=1 Tax=Ectobacillus ponti TaxID=2961894 RepID=A0AA41X858_9BACI|nr:homocysteine S-methyltransferase [Ectobacillus ponti]MCP8968115.1 homocysteine S-methyltransferase [Ectobacillus ponti]